MLMHAAPSEVLQQAGLHSLYLMRGVLQSPPSQTRCACTFLDTLPVKSGTPCVPCVSTTPTKSSNTHTVAVHRSVHCENKQGGTRRDDMDRSYRQTRGRGFVHKTNTIDTKWWFLFLSTTFGRLNRFSCQIRNRSRDSFSEMCVGFQGKRDTQTRERERQDLGERGMAKLCQVCTTTESKYKCPTCRAPYCSAACYKAHKETPCAPEAKPAAPPAVAATTHAQHQPAAPTTDAPSLPTTQIPPADEGVVDASQLLSIAQLDVLRTLPIVQKSLSNPAVRELLSKVQYDLIFAACALGHVWNVLHA